MLWILTATALSYVIGSIPTAYIFGRLLRGIDIRGHGSGNVGATNALRVLGKGPGILVLALDILKGFLPVLVFGKLIPGKISVTPELALLPVGLACICGHVWTIFLKFNGGKGIATTLGVLIGLAFHIPGLNTVLAIILFTWLLVFMLTRLVSLASVISAAALPFLLGVFVQSKPLLTASIFLSLFAIYRHKENLKRIVEGKEKKIFFGKS